MDVNGNDNQPEWGYCTIDDCREEAIPIWEKGEYPDDPQLLLCYRHIGQLIAQLRDKGISDEFKATILQAQLGGWEAACAAQVAAIRRALPYLEGLHDSQADMLIEDLTVAIDTNIGQTLLMQLTRGEGVATAAAIALYEIDSIGAIQPHTRSLLMAALDAFEAGKGTRE